MPSRKARINHEGPVGQPFVISEVERKVIENEYGNSLSEKTWDKIIEATSELTMGEPQVRDAASLKAVLKKLYELGDVALALRNDIAPTASRLGNFADIEEIWYFYFLKRRRPPLPREFFLFLIETLDPLIAIGELAHEFETDGEFSIRPLQGRGDGDHWIVWVNTLGQILDSQGFPFTVRKDVDKKPQDLMSPFVAFIDKLQDYIPKTLRRYKHSKDALAQGISRARKAYKDKVDLELKRFAEAEARGVELVKRPVVAECIDWRLRDVRAAILSGDEEQIELFLASNDVVDYLREGKLDSAGRKARDLLLRFPTAYDGYDRLGMVYQACGKNRHAAECYRMLIEHIKQHPQEGDPDLRFYSNLADELDPPNGG
jgi:hypothetical protein